MPYSRLIQAHPATDELLQHIRGNVTYFDSPKVASAMRPKLHVILHPNWLQIQLALIQYVATLPNQQPLHLDLVRSNVLFAPATPTDPLQLDGLAGAGIIDFEKTAWGHPLLDVARTLAFLLVDCLHKTTNQIRKYFLHSGYIKRGGGVIGYERRPGQTRLLLDELVDYYLFYDFSKFLRHNPYESLRHNLHYRRTRNLLLARHILTPDDIMERKPNHD
jgi:hypothetical protein